jgi:ribonuclease BN (tRNA processing enzyme)
MRVCLLGTGGAANEARHQAGVLVEWGEGARGGRILLDTGGGLDIVRLLIAAECEPADRRVLAAIEDLFGAVATAVPRLFNDKLRWVDAADGEPAELRGGARLTTFLVDHEPPEAGAMGCMVERDGTRLVYSGDTRPTKRLIEAARGADVLIHESGGFDAQAAEVHRLGHSTAGDAARVAAAAGVGRLILTHIPAERLAEPMLAEARAAFGGPVELASDLGLIEV